MQGVWELSIYHVGETGYFNKLFDGKPSEMQVFEFLKDYLKYRHITSLEALTLATKEVMFRGEHHMSGYSILLGVRHVFKGEG